MIELGKLVLLLSRIKEKFSQKEGVSCRLFFFVIKGPDVKKKYRELVKRRMF